MRISSSFCHVCEIDKETDENSVTFLIYLESYDTYIRLKTNRAVTKLISMTPMSAKEQEEYDDAPIPDFRISYLLALSLEKFLKLVDENQTMYFRIHSDNIRMGEQQ